MDIQLEPGMYVVAISGGVDSMVLLDLLRKRPGVRLIVAHYDHGIRNNSSEDRRLVQDVVRRHELPFVYDEGKLGADASEEKARKARYEFLRKVRDVSGAKAIVTAHHQDDLLETAIHNLLRGTGRRGLVSLRSSHDLRRPLLHVTKSELIDYAKDQGLIWYEDSTNTDLKYRRNLIRHKILPKFTDQHKKELLQHIRKVHSLDEELESVLTNHLHLHPGVSELDRGWFIMLPHSVAREVMAAWLRKHKIKDMNKKSLERLVMAAKTYAPGNKADVDKHYVLEVKRNLLALEHKER